MNWKDHAPSRLLLHGLQCGSYISQHRGLEQRPACAGERCAGCAVLPSAVWEQRAERKRACAVWSSRETALRWRLSMRRFAKPSTASSSCATSPL